MKLSDDWELSVKWFGIIGLVILTTNMILSCMSVQYPLETIPGGSSSLNERAQWNYKLADANTHSQKATGYKKAGKFFEKAGDLWTKAKMPLSAKEAYMNSAKAYLKLAEIQKGWGDFENALISYGKAEKAYLKVGMGQEAVNAQLEASECQ